MNQKFILFAEKTSKKSAIFEEQKPKKFTRKRSQRQKSFDSKRSKQQSIGPQYIKNVGQIDTLKLSRIKDESSMFLQKLSTSGISNLDNSRMSYRKTAICRTNTTRCRLQAEGASLIKIESLEAQIELKNHEIEVSLAQCERYKMQANDQKQKRRRIQNQKKQLQKQFGELQKVMEKLKIQNKKLVKEKQYLAKQVQFLQKINYDEKARSLQSFREKYLQNQIVRLRYEISQDKDEKYKILQQQLQNEIHEKDSLSDKLRSLNSYICVVLKKNLLLEYDVQELKYINKETILKSAEYLELKERYKRFLLQYKELKAENWHLKSNQLDLILSSEEQPQQQQ